MLAIYLWQGYGWATMSAAESEPIFEQPGAFSGESEPIIQDQTPEDNFTIDTLRYYLREIGKVSLLDAEEEIDLSKRIEAGLYAGELLTAATETHFSIEPPQLQRDLVTIQREGEEALRTLHLANLRLVVSIAKRHQRRGLDLLDLIQEGNAGLMRAAEKFDYQKGFKFSTYATWWIRKSITSALANTGKMVRVPSNIAEKISKLHGVQRDLRTELGREPTNKELAIEMDCPIEKIELYLDLARDPISLNQPAISEGNTTIEMTFEQVVVPEVPRTEELALDNIHIGQLSEALATLPDIKDASGKMLRDIICMHWGLFGHKNLTLEEIGKRFDRGREAIRLLEKKAFDQLLITLQKLGADANPHASLPRAAKKQG